MGATINKTLADRNAQQKAKKKHQQEQEKARRKREEKALRRQLRKEQRACAAASHRGVVVIERAGGLRDSAGGGGSGTFVCARLGPADGAWADMDTTEQRSEAASESIDPVRRHRASTDDRGTCECGVRISAKVCGCP